MTDKKLSELLQITDLDGSEKLLMLQGPVDKTGTLQKVSNFVNGIIDTNDNNNPFTIELQPGQYVDSIYVDRHGATPVTDFITLFTCPGAVTGVGYFVYNPAINLGGTISIDVPGVYDNGASGVGATITTILSSLAMDDTGDAVDGDQVVVRRQSNTEENGIYVVSGVGSAIVLTRHTAFDEAADMIHGGYTYLIGSTLTSVLLDSIVDVVGTDPVILRPMYLLGGGLGDEAIDRKIWLGTAGPLLASPSVYPSTNGVFDPENPVRIYFVPLPLVATDPASFTGAMINVRAFIKSTS